jgi:hypothetical protein
MTVVVVVFYYIHPKMHKLGQPRRDSLGLALRRPGFYVYPGGCSSTRIAPVPTHTPPLCCTLVRRPLNYEILQLLFYQRASASKNPRTREQRSKEYIVCNTKK